MRPIGSTETSVLNYARLLLEVLPLKMGPTVPKRRLSNNFCRVITQKTEEFSSTAGKAYDHAVTLRIRTAAVMRKKLWPLAHLHNVVVKRCDFKVEILVPESEMTNLLAARCQVYNINELPTRSGASQWAQQGICCCTFL
jgi:hypothetical protein